MALVYQIGHENNDFSEYSNTSLSSGALTIVSPGLGNTNFAAGCAAHSDSIGNGWAGRTYSSVTGTVFRFGWRVARDDLVPATSASGVAVFWQNVDLFPNIWLFISDGVVNVRVRCEHSDGGPTTLNGTVDIGDGDTTVELRIEQSSVDGASDGSYQLFINGVLDVQLANVDNFTEFNSARTASVAQNRLVAPSYFGGSGDFSGAMRVDLCTFRNDDTPIFPLATPGELTSAPMFKPCSIDADGDFIYIGGINSLGFPTLLKFSTALNADATVVFNPGAGSDIGVECGNFNADIVWVAGAFDSTNVVEKTEDGGTSFVVKDDGTFGSVTTFAVGPDSDKRVLIVDSNEDIHETIDDGDTWVTHQTAVGLTTISVARLDKNAQEIALGNEASANINIQYSVNTGANLQDYSDGFPEANVTGLEVG